MITSGPRAITAARDYAGSVAGGVMDRDRVGAVPAAEIAAFDASGLLAITVPREHGGPDLPASVLAEVIRVIAVVDPALAQVPQAHFLFTDVLAAWGTNAQQRRLFADVLAGGRFGNGLAERGGQHAQDLRTRLHVRGAEARLQGRKYYCTGDNRPLDRGHGSRRRRPPRARIRPPRRRGVVIDVDPSLVIPYEYALTCSWSPAPPTRRRTPGSPQGLP